MDILQPGRKKRSFIESILRVKLNEIFADIKELTVVHGIEDQNYLKA